MPEKASLQQGKLLQQRNVPCGALAKDSNTSRFRDQPFKTAATKSARTLPTECLKQQENSCSHEMFLAERLRKTRTPAGFVTNPSKQQPQKVPERYLRNALNSRKTLAATKCSLRSACERLEHQQVSWPTLQNSSHKKCPNVTYGMP